MKNENTISASEVWERILDKLNLTVQNPCRVIRQGDSKLEIRITLIRNRSLRRSGYHGNYRKSTREWILLQGAIYKAGGYTGKGIDKKVSIWKDGNVPEKIATKRIEEAISETKIVQQELTKQLLELMIGENKEKEFEVYLKSRYKDCEIVVHHSERATLKYKYFDIAIGRDEKVLNIHVRDENLFTWDLASVIQDVRPVRGEKRSNRLFRIATPVETKTKLVPKNEETK